CLHHYKCPLIRLKLDHQTCSSYVRYESMKLIQNLKNVEQEQFSYLILKKLNQSSSNKHSNETKALNEYPGRIIDNPIDIHKPKGKVLRVCTENGEYFERGYSNGTV
ncbi:MAG: hypothetical protein MHPSP_002781, partial [Paramarteilia canceri]